MHSDPKFDEIINDLFDIAIDRTKKDYHNTLEPFEAYKGRLKAQGLQAVNTYVDRVNRGYDLIIKRIDAEIHKKVHHGKIR